jgi:hypothetical protein
MYECSPTAHCACVTSLLLVLLLLLRMLQAFVCCWPVQRGHVC